ncbi:MAG: hypothetical protein ACTHJH_04290 [Marmoricola sp.]
MHQTALRPVRAGALALTSAALAAAGLAAPSNAQTRAADAPSAPVIVAHMGKNISLSRASVRAGKVTFVVRTGKGDHTMQIARLRHGYSMQQAGADINKAFGGDIDAINRVDNGVDFRGGAEARPGKAGEFTTSLGSGHYVVLDQSGPGLAMLDVHGTRVARRAPRTTGGIDIFTYGFATTGSLPHRGMVRLTNRSDQPHFVEFQHVKRGTTAKMVKRALMSPNQPSFALPGGTGTGVISPNRGQSFRYDLKPGRYLIACWWPDFKTGMPHAMMGMWKLIDLR